LKIADAVPRSGREPGRHDPAVGRERRRLGRADQEAQPEQQRERRRTGEEADAALQQREQRPGEDAERIDDARPEAIEQPAARQLRDHVRPAERREDEAHLHMAQVHRAGQRRARDRDRRAIRVVDGRDREQHGQHEPAHAGAPGRCRRGRRQCLKRIHDCLLRRAEGAVVRLRVERARVLMVVPAEAGRRCREARRPDHSVMVKIPLSSQLLT